jgi:hypothetical protein
MLGVLQAVLQSMLSQGETISVRQFAAHVLQVDGDNALLQAGQQRFSARIAGVRIKAGEHLLLERMDEKDGVSYCRVVRHILTDRAVETNQVFPFLIYTEDPTALPYLLVTRRLPGGNGVSPGARHWLFALHTHTLGFVILQLRENMQKYSATLLFETEAAADAFKPCLNEIEKIGGSGLIWRKSRLMTAEERKICTGTGTTLNRMG